MAAEEAALLLFLMASRTMREAPPRSKADETNCTDVGQEPSNPTDQKMAQKAMVERIRIIFQ